MNQKKGTSLESIICGSGRVGGVLIWCLTKTQLIDVELSLAEFLRDNGLDPSLLPKMCFIKN